MTDAIPHRRDRPSGAEHPCADCGHPLFRHPGRPAACLDCDCPDWITEGDEENR